jgi:hypothetical protein
MVRKMCGNECGKCHTPTRIATTPRDGICASTPLSHPFIIAKKLKGEATDGNEIVQNNIRENEVNDDESRTISHEIDKKVAEGIARLVAPGRSWFEC